MRGLTRWRTGSSFASHRRLSEVSLGGLGEVGGLVNEPVGALAAEHPAEVICNFKGSLR